MAVVNTVPRLAADQQQLERYLRVRDTGEPTAVPDGAGLTQIGVGSPALAEQDLIEWGFSETPLRADAVGADGFVVYLAAEDTTDPDEIEVLVSIEARSFAYVWPIGATRSYAIAAYRNTHQGMKVGPKVQAASWIGVESSISFPPLSGVLDPDLIAIGGLTGTGIACRTAADTWALRTLQDPASGLTITNPGGVAGDPTFDLANDLAALEGLGSTGFATRTAADTWAQRTLTAPAAGLTISNPAGIAGDPTFALANDLAAIEGLATTGIVVRSASDTFLTRSLAAPAAGFTISNNDGVSGNPTFVLANDLAALEGLGSTGIAVRSAADTWVQRTITAASSKISVADGSGVAANPAIDVVEANLTLSSIGGSVTDAQVPNTITLDNITQITTRLHSSLQSLLVDDHTQYALLAGRAGGQTLIGGTGASDLLTLKGTSSGFPFSLEIGVTSASLRSPGGTTTVPLRFYEGVTHGTNYVALKAPTPIAADLTFILPGADGSAGWPMQTDGGAALTFARLVTDAYTDDSVTFDKTQNIATSRILGRTTASSGNIEELTVGTGFTLSGGSLSLNLGAIDHNALLNLTTGDVHTHYALLAGRSGGQTIHGGTASGDDLILRSTAHATKGTIVLGDDITVPSTVAVHGTEDTITIGGVTFTSLLTVHDQESIVTPLLTLHKHHDTAAIGVNLMLARSRGTEASETVVAADDLLGRIIALGHDGTDYERAAAILMEVDGTPGAGDMPGRIVFQTTPDASGTLVEALRITQDRRLEHGKGGLIIDNANAIPGATVRNPGLYSVGQDGISLTGAFPAVTAFRATGTVTYAAAGNPFGMGNMFLHNFTYVNGGNFNPGSLIGYVDNPTVTADVNTLTHASSTSFHGAPTFNRSNSGVLNVTTCNIFNSPGITVGTACTVTTLNHVNIAQAAVSGTLTTQVGLKIGDLTAAGTDWSMQVGSAQSYHVGTMNFGTAAAVAAGHQVVVEGVLGVKQGSAADQARVGGVIFVGTAATGNVGGGTDDLISYTVPASTLGTNGDHLLFRAAGTAANNANAKTLTVVFGSTTLFSLALTISTAIDWTIWGSIVRTGAATQKAFVWYNANAGATVATADYTTPAETLSGGLALKLTGAATSNNDIVQEVMEIEWMPNNT